MAEKTLKDAFHETLKDLYYAEKQSVRALKTSARQARSPQLREAFQQHGEESANQVERLQRVFEGLGKPARGKTCEAMQGLATEMEEDLEEFGDTEAADDMLIACAQAIEHYEIARYGTLRNWAAKLGLQEAERLLGETLEEEKRADALLSQIAEELLKDGAESEPAFDREIPCPPIPPPSPSSRAPPKPGPSRAPTCSTPRWSRRRRTLPPSSHGLASRR